MASKTYQWRLDETQLSLPAPTEANENNVVEVMDAYARWVFGPGRSFLPAERIGREDPADFLSYIFSEGLAQQGDVKTADNPDSNSMPALEQLRVSTFDPTASFRPGDTRDFTPFGLLPIRNASISSEFKERDVHNLDEAVDPEKPIVISAVVDDGINVFNDRFQTAAGGSRIDYAWFMSAASADGPQPVQFGREITREEIVQARRERDGRSDLVILANQGAFAVFDGPYMPSVLTRATSHGTHIADLAAGYDPSEAAAIQNRIIAVQLPELAVADTSGSTLISSLRAAVIYVFRRAFLISRAYGTALPVVLNLSFTLSSGPRTGRSFIERAMREASRQYREACAKEFEVRPKVTRTLPAGNMHLGKLHASGLEEDGMLSINLRKQPEDQTSSFLEMWCHGSAELIKVSVQPPGMESETFEFETVNLQRAPIENAHVLAEKESGDTIARLTVDNPLQPLTQPFIGGAGRKQSIKAAFRREIREGPWWRVLLAIAPSRDFKNERSAAPFGTWSVSVEATDKDGEGAGRVRAWVLRDDVVSGLRVNSMQSYLEDNTYDDATFDRFGDVSVDDQIVRDSVVARDGSLSGLAVNAVTEFEGTYQPELDLTSVGAARWDTGQATLYTAADLPAQDQPGNTAHNAPSVMMAAEISRVLNSMQASGTLSGTSAFLNGTSVASAIVARDEAQHQLEGLDQQTTRLVPERPGLHEIELATARPIRWERLAKDGEVLVSDVVPEGNMRRGGFVKRQ